MTPPEGWPPGIDYDEAVTTVCDVLDRDRGGTSWDHARLAVRAIAPLIVKAVEEAEADADRLASLSQLRAHKQMEGACSYCLGRWPCPTRQALVAHEARRAGR